MKKAMGVAALALACFSMNAFAADQGQLMQGDPLELATKKQCLSCHSVDKSSVAPSFKEIAKKYGNQPKLEGALITQIMRGSPSAGGNHWGTMKMPGAGARPQVNVAEANQLLDWILSLK